MTAVGCETPVGLRKPRRRRSLLGLRQPAAALAVAACCLRRGALRHPQPELHAPANARSARWLRAGKRQQAPGITHKSAGDVHCAPKAQPIPAWGNAPGTPGQDGQRAESPAPNRTQTRQPMDRAFSPLVHGWQIPRALPWAGMGAGLWPSIEPVRSLARLSQLKGVVGWEAA